MADVSNRKGCTVMALGADAVSAVYRALLGHPPDAEGLAHWVSAGSLEELIQALVETDRFRERATVLAGASEGDLGALRAAQRLDHGAGLVELSDLPAAVAPFGGLDAVPWDAVAAGLGAPGVLVLGRYAQQLAVEISRRTKASAWAGLRTAMPRPPDVLVLTAGGDLAGVKGARPDLLRAVRSRIMVPLQLDPGLPAEERTARTRQLRAELHACGTSRVRHVFRRRHGGDTVVVDVSEATPVPGSVHVRVRSDLDRRLVPAATWFIGDRAVADEDVAS